MKSCKARRSAVAPILNLCTWLLYPQGGTPWIGGWMTHCCCSNWYAKQVLNNSLSRFSEKCRSEKMFMFTDCQSRHFGSSHWPAWTGERWLDKTRCCSYWLWNNFIARYDQFSCISHLIYYNLLFYMWLFCICEGKQHFRWVLKYYSCTALHWSISFFFWVQDDEILFLSLLSRLL